MAAPPNPISSTAQSSAKCLSTWSVPTSRYARSGRIYVQAGVCLSTHRSTVQRRIIFIYGEIPRNSSHLSKRKAWRSKKSSVPACYREHVSAGHQASSQCVLRRDRAATCGMNRAATFYRRFQGVVNLGLGLLIGVGPWQRGPGISRIALISAPKWPGNYLSQSPQRWPNLVFARSNPAAQLSKLLNARNMACLFQI